MSAQSQDGYYHEGHPTAQSQPDGAVELQKSASVPQIEGYADAKEGKVIVDYNHDIDYKLGGQIIMKSQSIRKERKKTVT